MARRDSRRLSPLDRAVLRSGRDHEDGRCFLPWPLSGAALNSTLVSLSNRDLVRIDWTVTGRACSITTPIGTITELGRKAVKGWLPQ